MKKQKESSGTNPQPEQKQPEQEAPETNSLKEMAPLTPDQELAYRSFVHTPSSAFQALVHQAKDIYGTTGISTGSPLLDSKMIPTRAPWIRIWIAPPGGGKTTVLRAIAKNAARQLVDAGMADTHYIAQVLYEGSVETNELSYVAKRGFTVDDFWRGKVDPKTILKAGAERAALPIYVLGESLMKSNIDSPSMYAHYVMEGLRAIWKVEGKLPFAIVWDYAQETEVKGKGSKRTEDVIQAMRDIISLAKKIGCPIELGVQAKQLVYDRVPPIPTMRDIEWAFYLGQKAANAIGLWRVHTTHGDNPKMQQQGGIFLGKSATTGQPKFYDLHENLMVAKPIKHRPGLLSGPIAFHLDADSLEITDLEDPYT